MDQYRAITRRKGEAERVRGHAIIQLGSTYLHLEKELGGKIDTSRMIHIW